MNYSYYMGIDVSKATLDIALMNADGQILREEVIKNNATALKRWLRGLSKQYCKSEILFCLEPTGHYSYVPVSVIHQAGGQVWLANAADIRHSIGVQRGKSDAVDARRIAQYAYRFSDKAKIVQDRELQLLKLRQLITYREKLVADKGRFQGQIKDFKARLDREVYLTIEQTNRTLIKQLSKAIAQIEKQIAEMIDSDEDTRRHYQLAQTVTGVGKVLATAVIAMTSDFSRFNSTRAFACHAGIAPFQYSSGSSIRGKNRVSHRANKRLKSLLHLAAMSSIRTKGDLQQYYNRKIQEGKSKMLVLNAVRNKIVSRIFSVIKRGTPYQLNLEIP